MMNLDNFFYYKLGASFLLPKFFCMTFDYFKDFNLRFTIDLCHSNTIFRLTVFLMEKHRFSRSGVLMGGYGGVPYPPKENFEAKVLNFAVLSFGSRILSFSFKF